jgi:GNAT superfamily N-acetyltransferase
MDVDLHAYMAPSLAYVVPMPSDSRVPRLATPDDAELVGRIGAAGFYDDPVLSWVVPDPATRVAKLTFLFTRLAHDSASEGRGAVWIVDDSCVALWRDPSFDHHPDDEPEISDDEQSGEEPSEEEQPQPDMPLEPDDLVRLGVLGETMALHHPHEPHWYLNVISTLPSHQGRGLGAAVLEPVLAQCDADGARAYLESTNPRNRTLYRRSGFVDGDEIQIPDGPTMLAMWRDPMV